MVRGIGRGGRGMPGRGGIGRPPFNRPRVLMLRPPEPAFPRCKPAPDDSALTQALLKRHAELCPTPAEQSAVLSLITKLQTVLDNLVVAPGDFAACEGKSEYLEGLLEATKELSHIDRANIFYHLLVTYCKADETDKALGLWTLLQEEGEVPSDQFLQCLGQHLKSKNRPVPFVIPQEKNVKTTKTTDVVEKIVARKEVPKPTKNDVSINIENMTKNGELSQAMDVAIKSIEHGIVPKSSVLKYLLKSLAEAGNVEKIQQLGNQINEALKRRVTYNDKLTLAIFTRGAGRQHVENLLESVKAAQTDEDLENALKQFPRSNALATVMQNEDLIAKCSEIAEIAASRGQILPANLLWMELLLCGKEKEAQSIWTKWLSTAPSVVYRRLLQESHTRKEPQLIEKLISLLKTNSPVSKGALGNAYSRLINYYVVENKLQDAEETFKSALKLGLKSEDFNKTTLNRLKSAVQESGRELIV